MLHQLAIYESKQIIESGMNTAKIALANAKCKVPFGEDTMNAMIVDASAALILDFQCASQFRHAVS